MAELVSGPGAKAPDSMCRPPPVAPRKVWSTLNARHPDGPVMAPSDFKFKAVFFFIFLCCFFVMLIWYLMTMPFIPPLMMYSDNNRSRRRKWKPTKNGHRSGVLGGAEFIMTTSREAASPASQS